MRTTRSALLSGLILVALVAVGLAAFSPSSTSTSTTTETGAVTPTEQWSGRAAAAVLATQLQPTIARSVEATDADSPAPEFTTTTPPTTSAPTTTAPVPTTTSPASSASATTTEAAAPTTTPTTVPPTTVPPTTAPPTTEAVSDENPYTGKAAVEQWRGLVASYFPASIVEDALRVIDCESNGDPNVVNPNSGAAGLFQFIPSTWANVSPMAGWAGADVLDPTANVAVAAWLSNYTTGQGQGPWQQWNCKP